MDRVHHRQLHCICRCEDIRGYLARLRFCRLVLMHRGTSNTSRRSLNENKRVRVVIVLCTSRHYNVCRSKPQSQANLGDLLEHLAMQTIGTFRVFSWCRLIQSTSQAVVLCGTTDHACQAVAPSFPVYSQLVFGSRLVAL